MGSTKASYAEIRERILRLDEDKLPLTMLEQLVATLPTPDEWSGIVALKNDYDSLVGAEQFCVVVSLGVNSLV